MSEFHKMQKFFLMVVFLVPNLLLSEPQSPQRDKIYGGELRLSVTTVPHTFNNFMARSTSVTDITMNFFEGLTSTDGVTGDVIPTLAESWVVSENGLIWEFKLREGVKWSDGVDLTADDVVFTFNDIIFNDDISPSEGVFTIDGRQIEVSKIDERTVKFILPCPFAPFLRVLGTPIYPQHVLEKYVEEGTLSSVWGVDSSYESIVGTGPFILTSYEKDKKIVLNKNPFYWKRDEKGRQLPYLDRIVFKIYSDEQEEYQAFLNGDIDYISLSAVQAQGIESKKSKLEFSIYNAGPNFGSQFFVFNLNSASHNPKTKWFQNLKFRQALAYAVNKEKIVNTIFGGYALPQWSPVSPSAGTFYNADVPHYDFNLEKARALLSEGGFIDRNQDGVIEDAEGNQIQINVITNEDNINRVRTAHIVSEDWSKLGISVNIESVSFNEVVNSIFNEQQFDVALLGLTGGIEPHFGSNIWKSEGRMHMWNPSQSEPATEWEKEIDQIFDRAAQELDLEKRHELYNRWQHIAAEQIPMIYTVLPSSIFAIRDRFGNLNPTPYGGAFHNIESIFVLQKTRNKRIF